MDTLRYVTITSWKQKQSPSTVSSFVGIPTPRDGLIGPISLRTERTVSGALDDCTRKSGSLSTDQSRPDITSITSITTRSTTTPQILPASPNQSITSTMERNLPAHESAPIWNVSVTSLLNGTDPKRGAHGTVNMPRKHGRHGSRNHVRANSAGRRLIRSQGGRSIGFALTAANQHGGVHLALTMLIASVRCAARRFGSIDTPKAGRVLANVRGNLGGALSPVRGMW